MQWFSIEEPFDFHVWITDRCQLTFEFGLLHFNQTGLILDLNNESWWLFLIGIVQIVFGEEHLGRVFLDCSLHLH